MPSKRSTTLVQALPISSVVQAASMRRLVRRVVHLGDGGWSPRPSPSSFKVVGCHIGSKQASATPLVASPHRGWPIPLESSALKFRFAVNPTPLLSNSMLCRRLCSLCSPSTPHFLARQPLRPCHAAKRQRERQMERSGQTVALGCIVDLASHSSQPSSQPSSHQPACYF